MSPRFRGNWAPLLVFVMWLAFLLGDIKLIREWSRQRDASDKWAVVFVTGSLLLLSLVLVSSVLEPILGRKMQKKATSDAPSPVLPVEIPEPAAQATPPFLLQVLTKDTMPPLSAAAQSLAQRGRDFYRQHLRIYRQGLWFLFACHLIFALLGAALGVSYPISLEIVKVFVIGALAYAIVGNPAKLRSLMVLGPWLLFNVMGSVVTVALAAIYATQAVREASVAAGALAGLTAVAIVAHAWIVIRRSRELRRRVAANPPLKLLFLWVFGSIKGPGALTMGFGVTWQYIGRIQLLSGAGYMGIDVLRAANVVSRGRTTDLIIKTPEELSERIRSFQDSPSPFVMYAQRTLLCNDAVWQLALDTLLNDSDVVLMDLRGFSPANQGAAYEIRRLIDRVPADRFVILADQSTRVDFLTTSLRQAWEAMAVDSPNRRSSSPLQVFHLSSGVAKKEFTRYIENAREGDVLLELMCERVVAGARFP